MASLNTTYLGFALPHPIVPGSSPLTANLETIQRLEDAGAAAIVLPSIFREQIEGMPLATNPYPHESADVRGEPVSPSGFEPDEYLEHVRRVKESTSLRIIGSMNGSRPGEWLEFVTQIARAGADAIELNVYYTVTDLFERGQEVEQKVLDVAAALKRSAGVPVSVKLSPYFSSVPNLARQLDDLGIDGLVLFNRFYQSDFDLERLEAVPRMRLSDSSELPLRLRALAVLAGRVELSLAATGGVHTPDDVIKATIAGADTVQVVSTLLQHGAHYLKELIDGTSRWLEAHNFESLAALYRSGSLKHCTDPQSFERGHYVAQIQTWRGDVGPVPQ
jgi:dihydroorotate dehydrogenase (fumarate)